MPESEWECWCRIRSVDPDGILRDIGAFEGVGPPDVGAVDRLARLVLVVARRGDRLRLVDVDPGLLDLLELAGLAGLTVEVEGQAEGREEALGIEEGQKEAHLGDGPA